MSETKGLFKRNFRVFLLFVVFAVVVYLIVRNINTFGNVLLVVVGFGAVIMIHELGHFIVAKLSGIKVTAFSIGFPPTLAGIQRTETGYRVRILPGFFRTEEKDESDDSLLAFTIGRKAKAGETEYRIGLIPFGGYNKILGQEDTKAVEASNDPRSFANKPVGIRMAVIAAGVLFNAISAILIFMIVFLIGIKLTPAVVGDVVPNSPAAYAGLKPGDEIIEIAGKKNHLDFSNILVAAALSNRDESVKLKVLHPDGSRESFAIVAKQLPGMQRRDFGVLPPKSLTIATTSKADANNLQARTGLLAGDRIISVNGKDVKAYWELEQIVQNALAPSVTVLAERSDPLSKKVETTESRIKLDLSPSNSYEVKSESDLSCIYSMVPRLRITAVAPVPDKNKLTSLLDRIKNKFLGLFGKADTRQRSINAGAGLKKGDIILAIGGVENPTYDELRKITTDYEDEELPVKVLRADTDGVERTLTVNVVPRHPPGSNRVMIGIAVALDAEHPVVARTISVKGGVEKLDIPRGASITAVDGTPVSNFYDIIREIRKDSGQRISIDYRLNEKIAGDVVVNVDDLRNPVTVKSIFAEPIPFKSLERLYKASGPVDAVKIGCKKTVIIIAQTYLGIKRLIEGLVGQKELSGPVGIIAMTYRIASRKPLIDYFYFFGLISVLLAVFNLLPIPPVDGGWLMLLLVEKIKGSALSERAQEIIAYAGIVFILSLFVYLTFNDILNLVFR